MNTLTIEEYMNTRPVTFSPEITVPVAVKKFVNSNQLGGPVVDRNGHVLGWVSEQDCLRSLIEETYHCEQVAQVADVMHKEVLTVEVDQNVLELAEQMLGNRPKMYPVVQEGVLVGVITRHHIIKAIGENLDSCFHT